MSVDILASRERKTTIVRIIYSDNMSLARLDNPKHTHTINWNFQLIKLVYIVGFPCPIRAFSPWSYSLFWKVILRLEEGSFNRPDLEMHNFYRPLVMEIIYSKLHAKTASPQPPSSATLGQCRTITLRSIVSRVWHSPTCLWPQLCPPRRDSRRGSTRPRRRRRRCTAPGTRGRGRRAAAAGGGWGVRTGGRRGGPEARESCSTWPTTCCPGSGTGRPRPFPTGAGTWWWPPTPWPPYTAPSSTLGRGPSARWRWARLYRFVHSLRRTLLVGISS